MNKREIIRSYGVLYHATAEGNWENICKNGLKPSTTGYDLTAYKGRPLICLSIPKMKHKWVNAIADKHDSNVTIIEIPADVVANGNFSLDSTNDELRLKCHEVGTCDFKTLLDVVGDLVCFDSVPANVIRRFETVTVTRSWGA